MHNESIPPGDLAEGEDRETQLLSAIQTLGEQLSKAVAAAERARKANAKLSQMLVDEKKRTLEHAAKTIEQLPADRTPAQVAAAIRAMYA